MSAAPAVLERPTIHYPGRGSFVAESRTVLSVSPVEYRKSYNRTAVNKESGWTSAANITYVLAASARDGYSICKIFDGQQMILDRSSVTDDNPGQLAPMPISAQQDAEDFVAHCTSGTIMRVGGPGVILCAGDEPTQEEIDRARAVHTVYARFMVNDAHTKFSAGNHKEITEEHRRQAEWLGVNVPWKTELEQVSIKKCPACSEDILAPALQCKHCQTFLPDFYVKAQLNVENDIHVKHFLAMKKDGIRAQEAPPADPPIHPAPGMPVAPPINKK